MAGSVVGSNLRYFVRVFMFLCSLCFPGTVKPLDGRLHGLTTRTGTQISVIHAEVGREPEGDSVFVWDCFPLGCVPVISYILPGVRAGQICALFLDARHSCIGSMVHSGYLYLFTVPTIESSSLSRILDPILFDRSISKNDGFHPVVTPT